MDLVAHMGDCDELLRSFHVLKMEILGRPNAATFCHHFAMGFLGSDWDVFCERFH